MAHQLSIVLSDEEYAALTAESTENGTTIEAIIHGRLALHGDGTQDIGNAAILDILPRQGIVASLPTGEDDTASDEAEAERLASLYSGGKSAAEMVIEDRGPY
jgi:hypothetical protein